MWFCYEKTEKGWQSVIYHQVKPGNELIKKVRRSPIYDIPSNMITLVGGEKSPPSFYKLEMKFPPPPNDIIKTNDLLKIVEK